MATANPSAFDTSQIWRPPDITPNVLRNRSVQGDIAPIAEPSVASAALAAATHEDAMRAAIRAAATQWSGVAKGDCRQILDTRWKAASLSIRSSLQRLQQQARHRRFAKGSETAWFVENAALITCALGDAREDILNMTPMPVLNASGEERLPRCYAAAETYLDAAGYAFAEMTFAVFAEAAQKATAFEMKEVWNFRACMQLALLERVAEIAAAISGKHERAERSFRAQMPVLIESLREISELEWKEVFERIHLLEQLLGEDPAGAYPRMDFESRSAYRKVIAELAARSKRSERDIARDALALARAAESNPALSDRARERRRHVGYYLFDDGVRILKRLAGYRPSLLSGVHDTILEHPATFYLGGIALATAAILALVVKLTPGWGWALLAAAAFLLPAAECGVSILNQLVTAILSPRTVAKLDFSQGIPAEHTTLVAVPALIASETQARQAVSDLEIRYLANRDPHLHFALLTDVPDSLQFQDQKDALSDICADLIRALNRKYAADNKGSFLLLHRHRAYNSAEGVWMGWERKRGKLLDLNQLVLGRYDAFPVKEGDLSVLRNVRYVITLDLDTQLPRESAHRLVGAMAHPLSRAVIDRETNTVVEGYGILQPRVEISVHSAARSRFAALLSGETGFDIYTRAVSDVYQDLFGEGIYTGKGIYDVETYQQVLGRRFPSNALLSHDMIEGNYVRAGLASDIEVVDDYPSHFNAYSRRKHRWVRGDWQIIFWLGARVPDFCGRLVQNPLSLISRWKIADNLRRSLTEFATIALLLLGWLVLPGKAIYWTLGALAVMTLPADLRLALAVARAGRTRYTLRFWRVMGHEFANAYGQLLFRLTVLLHQGMITLDAVWRSVVRMAVTRQRLLQWETAAQAESRGTKKSPVEVYLDWTPLLAVGIGILVACCRPASCFAALPILALWGSAKFICEGLDGASQPGVTRIGTKQREFLRGASLRTWRFFRELGNADENWLIPDVIQESPANIGRRVSPTDLGMLLDARLAACDLGFLTLPEFAAETGHTLRSMARMPRFHGHFYNWYDTQTLEVLPPYFVSTVDSGNLVCCLWTLKQGCLEARTQPIFGPQLWEGVYDQVRLLEELAAGASPGVNITDALRKLRYRVESLAGPRQEWLRALPGFEAEVVQFENALAAAKAPEEMRWWARELSTRVHKLAKMVQDFAPWLLAKLEDCGAPEVERRLRASTLTLESALSLAAELEPRLRSIAADPQTSLETRTSVQFLRAAIQRTSTAARDLWNRLTQLAEESSEIAAAMDFRFLYNPRKKLLSVGYDAETAELHSSHYGSLASEARSAAFAAISKGDIPQESWFRLKRSHTLHGGHDVLISWSGTMFEYLMPALWMRGGVDSLLDRSARAVVHIQREHAAKRRIPWGISESCCSERNDIGDHRYQAFGIRGLAMDAESSRETVISPYSVFLGLTVDAASATQNLDKMKSLGWLGSYGFYEAADFTASRAGETGSCEVVRCWMAHHQGMSLLAATNVLCGAVMQRRFHAEPLVQASERLLHEKLPASAPVEWQEEAAEFETEAGKLRQLPEEISQPVGALMTASCAQAITLCMRSATAQLRVASVTATAAPEAALELSTPETGRAAHA